MAKLTETSGGRAPFANMAIGETRMHRTVNEKLGIDRPITLTRTDRDFVFDLCDAYNNSMEESARRRGMQWIVLPTGDLKLDFSVDASRQVTQRIENRKETERAAFIRHQLNPPT